jgi:hypothetical protein
MCFVSQGHMLNMELDLRSLFGLLCTTPSPTPPPHLGSYAWALLVSQDIGTTSLCNPLVRGFIQMIQHTDYAEIA